MPRKDLRLRQEGLLLPVDLGENLTRLLEKETELYRSLGDSISREETAVDAIDMESLLLILQEKQSIIAAQEKIFDEWESISKALSVESGRESDAFWNAVESAVGVEKYSRIRCSVSDMKSLALELLQKEKDVQSKLENVVSDLRKQMMAMQKGRKAVQGYSRSAGTVKP